MFINIHKKITEVRYGILVGILLSFLFLLPTSRCLGNRMSGFRLSCHFVKFPLASCEVYDYSYIGV